MNLCVLFYFHKNSIFSSEQLFIDMINERDKQIISEIRNSKQKQAIIENIEKGNCMTAAEFCDRLEQLKISLQQKYGNIDGSGDSL